MAVVTERISIAQYRELLASGGVAKPKRAHPEEDLHRACFDLVGKLSCRHPILAWMVHYPAGGKRPKGEAGKLKAMGAKPGIPDLLLPRRNGIWTGFACELKSATGRLSSHQEDWLQALAAEGYFISVCRTVDEFQTALRQYLLGP